MRFDNFLFIQVSAKYRETCCFIAHRSIFGTKSVQLLALEFLTVGRRVKLDGKKIDFQTSIKRSGFVTNNYILFYYCAVAY